MKKHIKIVAALATMLITVVGVITFEACNKKNEIINNMSQTTKKQSIIYQTDVADRVAYILEFEKKLQSAEKSDMVLTVENANAFMFDILNYDFCNINGDGTDVTYETSTYTLNVSNGMINLNDFANLYSQISTHVYDYYYGLNTSNSNYYCILPQIKDFDANSEITTVSVKTTLTSGLSYRSVTYDSTLCDYFFLDEYQWSDAADTLTKYFNKSIYQSSLIGRVFFTNISHEHFDYEHFPQLYNCYGCSVLHETIDKDEMCDLLNAYLDLADDYRPSIKNIIDGYVIPHTASPENIYEQTTIHHTLDVNYGVLTTHPGGGL